jgi:hypothetical protein
MSIDFKEIKRRRKEEESLIVEAFKGSYKGMNFEDFIDLNLLASGQKRGPAFERWLVENDYYQGKVASSEDRGDLAVGDISDELKVRLDYNFSPTNKGVKKGKIFSGGQIRLWQKVDNYLFISVDIDTAEYFIYLILKENLIEHYRNNDITRTSSHGAGNSALVKEDFSKILSNKVELSPSLNSRKYDWSKYRITLEQLKDRCQKLKN